MDHFDSNYAQQLIERIKQIPEDAVPLWGVMKRKELIEHFIWSLQHIMGRSTRVPDFGTWFSRAILKKLIINGIVPIPKNATLPPQLAERGVVAKEPGDLETFHAIVEEYLQLVQADELVPAPHFAQIDPFFGPLTIDEWDKLAIKHFEHHLKQLGCRTSWFVASIGYL